MPTFATERLLDVSELDPPEPLRQVLTAIDELAQGEYLHMLHRREPFPLYPELERRGFHYLTTHELEFECEVFIWRVGDSVAESACRNLAGQPS